MEPMTSVVEKGSAIGVGYLCKGFLTEFAAIQSKFLDKKCFKTVAELLIDEN